VWFSEEEMAYDNYIQEQQSVWYELQQEQVLPSVLGNEVMDCLYELLQPYRLKAYRRKFEEFYDEIMDTRLKFSIAQTDFEKFIYESARLENIGNKGSRSDMLEQPPGEVLGDKRKNKK